MRSKGSAGFTLLEVVVSVAILGVGVAACLQIFSSGLSNIRRIDVANQAMWHAENVMNELLTNQEVRDAYQASDDLGNGFFYQAQVDYWYPPDDESFVDEGFEDAEASPYVLEIIVDVLYRGSRNERRYRLSCLKTVVPEDETNPFQSIFGRQDNR